MSKKSVAEQLTHEFGGETDELDLEDLSAANRGDSVVATADAPVVAAVPEVKAEPAAEETAAADDVAAKAAEEAAAAAKKAADWIPRDRFDKVNNERKAAQERLAKLDAERLAAEAGTPFDYDAAEEKYMEAVLDGKTDEAKQIRREIRAAERAEVTASTREAAVEEVTLRGEERVVAEVIAEAEKTYPQFDPTNDDQYSQELTEDVVTYYQVRLSRGDDRPTAMRKAIDAVVKANGIGAPVTPPPAPAKPRIDASGKVAVAKSAPPPLSSAGAGGDAAGATATIDINNLSDKELSALPESTLQRLRGDFV